MRAYSFAALVIVEDAKKAEKLVHAALAEVRGEGEWFRVSAEKATAFIQTLAVS